MRFADGPPKMWHITLKSGNTIELWAESFATEPVDDHWIFSIFAEATDEELQAIRTEWRTDPPSQQCYVTVARNPVHEVESILGGWALPDAPAASTDQ